VVDEAQAPQRKRSDDSADEPVTSPSPVEGAGGLTARPPAKARLHLVDGEYPNQEVTTTAITA
jgi:hypothetical protein